LSFEMLDARHSPWIVAAALLVACSGAPHVDGPDYELAASSGSPAGPSGGSAATDPPPSDQDPGNPDTSSEYDASPPPPPSHDAGAADAKADVAPPPKPATVSVTIDGASINVDGTTLWSEVSQKGMYNIFIKVSGTGVPSGSDFDISATATGQGCVNTANYITYRPSGDTQYMPASPNEPTCGLTITSIPTAIGGRFKGSFNGKLHAINVSTPRSKTIVVSFDVPRTQ
jgi:hypothetical protein